MFVAMVIAPSLPASATICASCSCWRAFRTLWGSPALVRSWLSISDLSIDVVPDQHRLPAVMGAPDGLDDGVVFFLAGAVDLIVLVDPGDGPVSRDLDHAKPVDRHEFLSLGDRGARHAGKLVVEAEIVLEGHARHGDVLGLDLAAFLGLDGLMQAVRQAAALHHPAGEFVDQNDLAAAHHVLLILGEELVRPERVGHVVDDGGAFRVVEALPLRQDLHLVKLVLEEIVALVGEGRAALLLVEGIVFLGEMRDHLVDGNIEIRTVLAGPRDDQRRPRASSIRIESTSSTMAKLCPRWAISSRLARMLSRR